MLSVIVFSVAFTVNPVSLSVDTKESKVKWTGYHLAKSYEHYGYIDIKSGNLEVEDGDLVGGSIVIDMNTIAVKDLTDEGKNKKLTGHLKSDDFFNVAKFPEATLVITKVMKEDASNYKVMGDITIRGIKEPITFTVQKMSDNQYTANIAVDRTKHEVSYGWTIENAMLSNTFDLEVQLSAN